MASPAPAKFRIDVDIHNLLMNSGSTGPKPAEALGTTLPTPVFPQYPELLNEPGPEVFPHKRDWGMNHVWRSTRGWRRTTARSPRTG